MDKALGLIEVIGYVTAMEAADAALKAANVQLIGIIKVDGGIMTVQLTGDVGAVQSATDAGKEAALRLGTLRGAHVIPRISDEVAPILGKGATKKAVPTATSLLAPTQQASIATDTSVSAPTEQTPTVTVPPQVPLTHETLTSVEVTPQKEVAPSPEQAVPKEEVTHTPPTLKELKNMSNKELKTLIHGLGIVIPSNKVKTAKKDDLIKIVLKFYGQEGDIQ